MHPFKAWLLYRKVKMFESLGMHDKFFIFFYAPVTQMIYCKKEQICIKQMIDGKCLMR